MTAVTPFSDSGQGKKKQVEDMFNQISSRYDFMNRFLSLGIDRTWRRKAVNMLKPYKPARILDVATGTGDFAIQALETGAAEVVGIDISEGMLAYGAAKVKALNGKVKLMKGDSEQIAFPDNSFDAVIVAFGVRNFENLQAGLREMLRVLKPGGHVVVLEFSKPARFPVKQVYYVYFHYLLPFWGRLLAKNREAYTYLPRSVAAFPEGESFLKELDKAGYRQATCKPLSFGISSIYSAVKAG